jgi:cell division initiation protein
MPLTPLDVHEQTFRVTFRGFDPQEVDEFLQRVAEELERLQAELEAARAQPLTAEAGAVSAAGAAAGASAEQEAELLLHRARTRADRVLARANEELLRLRNEVDELAARREQFLGELEALAQGLGDWVRGRSRREVLAPELLADEDAEELPATASEGEPMAEDAPGDEDPPSP